MPDDPEVGDQQPPAVPGVPLGVASDRHEVEQGTLVSSMLSSLSTSTSPGRIFICLQVGREWRKVNNQGGGQIRGGGYSRYLDVEPNLPVLPDGVHGGGGHGGGGW